MTKLASVHLCRLAPNKIQIENQNQRCLTNIFRRRRLTLINNHLLPGQKLNPNLKLSSTRLALPVASSSGPESMEFILSSDNRFALLYRDVDGT